MLGPRSVIDQLISPMLARNVVNDRRGGRQAGKRSARSFSIVGSDSGADEFVMCSPYESISDLPCRSRRNAFEIPRARSFQIKANCAVSVHGSLVCRLEGGVRRNKRGGYHVW